MNTTRVALVTGAGTGIGRAVALRLAKDGAAVACAGRRAQPLEATAAAIRDAGGDALVLPMDVTKEGSVADGVGACARWRGAIDVLVNNAGAGGPNDIGAASDERWHTIVDTNLTGTYLVTRAALPHMPGGGGGRVINVASVLGRFGVPGYTAYCASKHGLIGFTKALALEVAGRGITVNAVCPGWVATDMAREGMEAGAKAMGISVEEFHRQAMERVPIGRMLEPAEIAAVVAYLVSDAAAGMTGQGLDLNGGSFMQ